MKNEFVEVKRLQLIILGIPVFNYTETVDKTMYDAKVLNLLK